MKKLIALLLVLALTLGAMVGCSKPAATESEEPAATPAPADDFKVGIMAHSVTFGEENYRYSMNLQEKYGEDHVIVDTFPDTADAETVISKALAMAADPKVKVIMFNIGDNGTIAAINAVKEVRDDIVTIVGNPSEDIEQVAAIADLIMMKDHTNLAKNMVAAAANAGCKTFIHYSFPRHMASQTTAQRAKVFKETCEANGIAYYEVTTPDPNGDSGVAGTQQFILEDVPLEIEKYGKDTCFFGTNQSMFEPMIKSICENGGLFFGQADPTCVDHFPGALGIEVPADKVGDLDYMNDQITKKVAELGMTGRIGTWNKSMLDMMINCSYQIGTGYVKGESASPSDFAYAEKIIKDYGGEGTTVSHYTTGDGKQIDNVILYCCGTRVY